MAGGKPEIGSCPVSCSGGLSATVTQHGVGMQFMFGVGGYIIARVLAILLPLFFVNQPGQEDLAIRIVLILENIVLWGFLGALAYIFRSAHLSVPRWWLLRTC